MLFITFEQGVVRGLVEGEDEGSQVREGDLLVPRDCVDSPGRQRRGAVLGNRYQNVRVHRFGVQLFSKTRNAKSPRWAKVLKTAWSMKIFAHKNPTN